MSRREERRYTSAKEWAEKQSLGYQAQYLKLPKGVKLFKPKEGTMLLDIIPFKVGEGNPNADEGMVHWERTFWVHRGIGANNESYLCPRKTSKSPCPICEHRAALMKKADDDDEDLIKSLAPKQRQLLNILNLKDPDKGVQLWDVSYHLFGEELVKALATADEDEEWDKFFLLEDGLTLKVAFGEDHYSGRAFLRADRIDFRSRHKQYDEEMLEEAICLDEVLQETEYDDLKKAYREMGDDEDDDDDRPRRKKDREEEDEDDRTIARRRKDREAEEDDDDRKGRKSKREEEEEDDKPHGRKPKEEDDDWDDFEEDRGHKSKRGEEEEDEDRKGRKSKKDDDDDDDDKGKEKGRKSKEDDDEWDDLDKDFDDEKEGKRGRKSREDDDDDDGEKERPRVRTKDEIDEANEEEDRRSERKSRRH